MLPIDRRDVRMAAAVILAAVLACAPPLAHRKPRRPRATHPMSCDNFSAVANTQTPRQRARGELATLTRSGEADTLRAAEVLDVLVVAMWRGGKASNDEAVSFRRARHRDQTTHSRQRGIRALATSLDNAGVLFFVRGEYDNARQHYQRALAILVRRRRERVALRDRPRQGAFAPGPALPGARPVLRGARALRAGAARVSEGRAARRPAGRDDPQQPRHPDGQDRRLRRGVDALRPRRSPRWKRDSAPSIR